MNNEKSNIGMFGALSNQDKNEIISWFNTEFVLFFYFCLYSETDLANRFEMSDNLIKRRNAEMKLLNKICDKTGYTPDYFIALIKTTLPKLYTKYLPTLQSFYYNVESGKFTGTTRQKLLNGVNGVVYRFCWMLAPTFEDLAFDTELGTPNFQSDFTLKIINNPKDIYNPKPIDPVTPVPPVDPVTPVSPVVSTASFSLSNLALPLALGGVALIALFRKK